MIAVAFGLTTAARKRATHMTEAMRPISPAILTCGTFSKSSRVGKSDLVADVTPDRSTIHDVVVPYRSVDLIIQSARIHFSRKAHEIYEVECNHPESQRNRPRVSLNDLPIHGPDVEQGGQRREDDKGEISHQAIETMWAWVVVRRR